MKFDTSRLPGSVALRKLSRLLAKVVLISFLRIGTSMLRKELSYSSLPCASSAYMFAEVNRRAVADLSAEMAFLRTPILVFFLSVSHLSAALRVDS